MAAEQIPSYISLETYYAFEAETETKNEYQDGMIVAMSGGSQPHVDIIRNISSEMVIQLRDSSCLWYPSELRVYSALCNSVFYPDVTVVCETPRFGPSRLATLLNPALIVEVLSASTEARDRGEKSDCYRAIASLTTYVLVAQDKPLVEVFTRQADDSWHRNAYSGLDAVVPLPAIGCELRLTEVYRRVALPLHLNSTQDTDNDNPA